MDSGNTKDFLLPGSTCAVAASSTSVDSIGLYFPQCMTQNVVVDNYGHMVPPWDGYLVGHYLEKVKSTSKGHVYKMSSNKKICFYKEIVLYPFVQLAPLKNNLFLTAANFVDSLSYVQHLAYYAFDS